MKMDKRYAPILNGALMALILPFFMTLVVSLANLGFTEKLVAAWMRTWMIASAAAFPLILVLSPMIKRFVGKMTA